MAMKHRVAGMTLAVLALAAMPALADPVSVGDQVYFTGAASRFTYNYNDGSTDRSSGGGGFNLYNNDGAAPFVTFCLERGESIGLTSDLNKKSLYNVAGISDSAQNGGKAGQDPVGSNTDPLDFMTKYIYFSFRTQAPGWAAADVQEAIWFIENEIPDPTDINKGTFKLSDAAQVIYNEAFGINPGTFSFGNYNVRALNLKALDGSNAQDVLALQPVPEPASLMLLGSGLLGLAAWRRKRQ